jgi:hypothetical protein
MDVHPKARKGTWILGAILVLGIVVIAIPLVFLITTRVVSAFPTSGLTANQKGNLSSMEAIGASSLSLTAISEFVLGASIVLGALFLLFRMRT